MVKYVMVNYVTVKYVTVNYVTVKYVTVKYVMVKIFYFTQSLFFKFFYHYFHATWTILIECVLE